MSEMRKPKCSSSSTGRAKEDRLSDSVVVYRSRVHSAWIANCHSTVVTKENENHHLCSMPELWPPLGSQIKNAPGATNTESV